MNIRKKIYIPAMSLILFSCLAVLLTSVFLFNRQINNAMYDKVRTAKAIVENELEGVKTNARLASIALANNPDLIEALINGDMERVSSIAAALKLISRADHCTVIDSNGFVITRTHDPGNIEDNVRQQPHVAQAFIDNVEAFVTPDITTRLGIYAAAPVYASVYENGVEERRLIGIVSIGFKLDSQELVYELNALTGCEVTIFLRNERIASTILYDDGSYVMGTTVDRRIGERVLTGNTYFDYFSLFGKSMLGKYTPLVGANDVIVGMLFVGHYTADDMRQVYVFAGIALSILAVVLAASFYSAKYVSVVIEKQLGSMMDEIRGNHDHIQQMVDYTPLGINIMDENYKIIDCNAQALMMFGFGQEEKYDYISGFQTFTPERQPNGEYSFNLRKKFLEAAFRDGYARCEEWLYVTPDGEPLPCEVTLVRTAYRNRTVLLLYMLDLRELKSAISSLGQADERAALMLDATPLCINFWDKDYNNIDCNKTAAEFFGFDSKQKFLERFYELSPKYQPDGVSSSEKARALIGKAFEEGFCRSEWMNRMPDGEPVPSELTFVRVKHREDYIVAVYMRDLREEKAALAKLTKSRDIMEKMLESMDVMIVITEVDSDRIIYLNKSFMKEFDFNDDVIGQTCWRALIPNADSRCDFCPKKDPKFLEFKLAVWEYYYPGKQRHYRVTSRYIDWLDGSPVFIEQFINITNIKESVEVMKKALDAADEANRTKSAFLANMSHEIRTPMNSIIGFSELAQFGQIPSKTREYLINIQESAEWLLKIINDILDISKIESGKIEVEHIPFDLHDVLAHCQAVIKPKSDEKGITLYFYAEPSIAGKLFGDPVRLRQALLNLLTNAVKFTNTGMVKFLTTLRRSNDRQVTIHFEIKDSGIGMTQDQINRIFEPFNQADNSITRRFGGTGLGLAITKNIIELMGGELAVESIIGVGSKFGFEITFDVIDEADFTTAQNISMNNLDKPTFNGEVLVCEDNSLNQQVICEHLQRVGLRAVVAHNGKEGVDIIKERLDNKIKQFDLILMDIHMPIMDGLEAAAYITAMDVKTPIVAITANIMSNDLELYKMSGMSDCVGKPFTSQDLWKCLIKFIPVVDYFTVSGADLFEGDSELQRKLKLDFVKNNQNIFSDITQAIIANDIKLAHRLAHTLKSNAGQIGKTRLQESAAAVEKMLAPIIDGGIKPTAKQLAPLDAAIKTVLDELAPLLAEQNAKPVTVITDPEQIAAVYEELEEMLVNKNPECEGLLDTLRAIPNTQTLVYHIEKFKFKLALEELQRLK